MKAAAGSLATGYRDRRSLTPIARVTPGVEVTVDAVVSSLEPRRRRGGRSDLVASLRDSTGFLRAVWFNQSYVADKLLHEIPVVKCEPCAGTGDRIVDGLFMLYFGGVMAFMALWGADIVTLRLRTGRVVLLVLAAVFVVLFLVVMVHGVANMPD